MITLLHSQLKPELANMTSLTSQLALGALLYLLPKAKTTGRMLHPVFIYMGSGESKLWSSALTMEPFPQLEMNLKVGRAPQWVAVEDKVRHL